MAGDVGIHEQVVVLGSGAPEAAVRSAEAVASATGAVTHQYGPRVLVAAVDTESAEALRRQVAAPAPDGVPADLDEIGAMGLAAFRLRQSEEYAAAKAARPLAGEDWDYAAASAPDAYHPELGASSPTPSEAGDEAGAPTSARLTGRVAVGVIIVNGPTAALQFTPGERTKVVAEVQNGLSWLGAQSSPAGVSFVYDIRNVSITAHPSASDTTSQQKEARFRDPALAQLGFGPGHAGARAYIEKLRTNLNTNWSYCVFFTKYPVGHFAYAFLGGPHIVMDYANDGWGPDNIDRVFAHETGHIFNAPDEYASSNCSCGGEWGFFKQPNDNCASCASGGGVPCIMKSNDWAMCSYTPYHLGFPQGQRYSGVFKQATGAYGLWVNADWNHFVAKWKEWSAQGLRLDDIEISQPGGQLRLSGVFTGGRDAYGLWGLADWSSFVAKWKDWSGQGLRLVDLEVTDVGGGQLRYTGAFRGGTDGYGLWVLADWNSFVAKWKEWSGKGLRLVDFTVTLVNGQPRYSGVFRAGTDAYGLWALADWKSFVAKWQDWSGKGLRLVDLEITRIGNETRYSGVFRAGGGAYGLWVNADWSSFLAKWQQWSGQGMRLVDFDVTLTGIEEAAAPPAGSIVLTGEEPADVPLPVSAAVAAVAAAPDGSPDGAGPEGVGARSRPEAEAAAAALPDAAGVGMLGDEVAEALVLTAVLDREGQGSASFGAGGGAPTGAEGTGMSSLDAPTNGHTTATTGDPTAVGAGEASV